MAKQRQSVQKRIREQKKREREQRKLDKAAAKAERRSRGGGMTEEEYGKTMARIEELMDAKKGSPEGDELDLLARRAEEYETEHRHLDGPGQDTPGVIR